MVNYRVVFQTEELLCAKDQGMTKQLIQRTIENKTTIELKIPKAGGAR